MYFLKKNFMYHTEYLLYIYMSHITYYILYFII